MPLDVMKTRMQLDTTPLTSANAKLTSITNAAAAGAPAPVERRGLISTGVHIYKTEGFRRLYLGLAPAVLRQAIVGGIGVGLYPQIKDLIVHLNSRSQRNQSWRSSLHMFDPEAAATAAVLARTPLSFGTKVVAGAISGVIGQLLAAPTCVVKVRLQADARLAVPRYNGTLDALIKIPRQEGFRSLFSGIVPSLQRAAFMYGATISTSVFQSRASEVGSRAFLDLLLTRSVFRMLSSFQLRSRET
jgi:solute carrier family 25 uncoupling protein 8/9